MRPAGLSQKAKFRKKACFNFFLTEWPEAASVLQMTRVRIPQNAAEETWLTRFWARDNLKNYVSKGPGLESRLRKIISGQRKALRVLRIIVHTIMSCKRSRGLCSCLSGGLSPMAQEDLGSTTAHSKCFLSPQVLQSDLGRTKNQPIKNWLWDNFENNYWQ